MKKRLKPEQGIKVVTKLFRYNIFMLQSSKSPYRQFLSGGEDDLR